MYKKLLIVSTTLLLVASAVEASPTKKSDEVEATITAQDQIINADGSYAYSYETSNGIKANQHSENGVNAAGVFSFVAPDTGAEIRVTYTADEKGFQPQGAHLPVEPPAPEYVIKMLEDLRGSGNKDLDMASLEATIARLKATRS